MAKTVILDSHVEQRGWGCLHVFIFEMKKAGNKMRYLVMLMFVAACNADSSTPRVYSTESQAVDKYCEALCGWADKCGGFYPDACGSLCTGDCLQECRKEVCVVDTNCDSSDAPADTDEAIDTCIKGMNASTSDCTEYRPHPAGCEQFIGQ